MLYWQYTVHAVRSRWLNKNSDNKSSQPNTRTPHQPNKQTNMHQERLIAIDTIILSSESTPNHPKLAQHSLGKKTDSLFGTLWIMINILPSNNCLSWSQFGPRKGAVKICYDAEGRSELLTLYFWPAGAQRKTLVREGRNLCAINCLSLKSYLISTAECLSTRYRDNKGMKRPGWYGWIQNPEFKSFAE